MEIFVWPKDATCAEHRRLYPEQSPQVKIRLPLLSPQIQIGALCSCQNSECQIRPKKACSGRAVLLEISPNIITPEQHSAFRPRLKLARA